MSKLPQVNVRLAPEHHDLIRSIAARLRNDPDFAKSLALILDSASPKLEGTSPWLARLHDLEARMTALEKQSMPSGAPSLPDEAEPTQPRLTMEQTHRITAMMKDGKSATEIMTTMGLPLLSMEEIKQRLLNEI
jgi:hypothetical protein